MVVDELADFGFHQGTVELCPKRGLAVPALSHADEDFVVAIMQVGRDVPGHDERVPVQLGNRGLQYEVAHKPAVDEQVMIAQ